MKLTLCGNLLACNEDTLDEDKNDFNRFDNFLFLRFWRHQSTRTKTNSIVAANNLFKKYVEELVLYVKSKDDNWFIKGQGLSA